MSEKPIILEGVSIGEGPKIGPFCLIGENAGGTPLKTKIGDNANIRSHTVIYAGNVIGDNFQTGHHAFVQEQNKIGNNVSIGTMTSVLRFCTIGDDVRIHTGAFIPEYTVIKKGAWIGPGVVITNTLHPKCKKAKECMKKTYCTVGEKAIIGAHATILPEVSIGRCAVVGAGAVVTKDVPDKSVVVGNPAKVIKKVSELSCKFNMVDKPYSDGD